MKKILALILAMFVMQGAVTIAAAIIQCMPYTGTPNALHALAYLKQELKK